MLLSKDKCMSRVRYNHIFNNLHGFDLNNHMRLHIVAPGWINETN
jgi:hypothetical protein